MFSLTEGVICEFNKLLCHHSVFNVGGHSVIHCQSVGGGSSRGESNVIVQASYSQLINPTAALCCWSFWQSSCSRTHSPPPPRCFLAFGNVLNMSLFQKLSVCANVGFNGFINRLVSLFQTHADWFKFLGPQHIFGAALDFTSKNWMC